MAHFTLKHVAISNLFETIATVLRVKGALVDYSAATWWAAERTTADNTTMTNESERRMASLLISEPA